MVKPPLRTTLIGTKVSNEEYAQLDPLNRLSTLTNSWAGQFGFAYDDLSRRTSLTRPNGVRRTRMTASHAC